MNSFENLNGDKSGSGRLATLRTLVHLVALRHEVEGFRSI